MVAITVKIWIWLFLLPSKNLRPLKNRKILFVLINQPKRLSTFFGRLGFQCVLLIIFKIFQSTFMTTDAKKVTSRILPLSAILNGKFSHWFYEIVFIYTTLHQTLFFKHHWFDNSSICLIRRQKFNMAAQKSLKIKNILLITWQPRKWFSFCLCCYIYWVISYKHCKY